MCSTSAEPIFASRSLLASADRDVKRNDQVHRGQVIAKSGQTGTAPTPQLHFEIRKNSAPVDPMQYLPSDKTASAPL